MLTNYCLKADLSYINIMMRKSVVRHNISLAHQSSWSPRWTTKGGIETFKPLQPHENFGFFVLHYD